MVLQSLQKSQGLPSRHQHHYNRLMKKYSENPMSYTSNSFSRQNPPSYLDRDDSEAQGYTFDPEELRLLVQNEVYKGLLTIKGQIQTKIKQIDRQIKELRQSFQNMREEDSHSKIIQLEDRQFQIAQKVKQILERGERDRIPPSSRNQLRRSIDRSGYLNDSKDRPSSKDRKPIFNKPQINLSTVLFPFSQNQEPPITLRQDRPLENKKAFYQPQSMQSIQQLNSLIVNDIHQSPFQIPLNLSSKNTNPLVDIMPVVYQQKVCLNRQEPMVEGLVKNKNKFLKKKSVQEVKRQGYGYEKDKFGTIEEESIQESMIRR